MIFVSFLCIALTPKLIEGAFFHGNQSLLQKETTYLAPICNDHLSGVADESVRSVIAHQSGVYTKGSTQSNQLGWLQQQKIFIAVCLHNSENIMRHWTWELIRLSIALKGTGSSTNLFVSVYESGSTDNTPYHLDNLREHLKFLNIPNQVVHGGVTRNGRQRIPFLADMRNRAMLPLQNAKTIYDQVLWLSDSLFCADGVLQMLAHALPVGKGGLGADAVCGMDFAFWQHDAPNTCVFYDIWASHDMTGHNFRSQPPVVSVGEKRLAEGKPFQVFSGWNAMVVFSADIFQKEHIMFRSSREQLNECRCAETELIFRDMWTIGRGKIAVSPSAASAYNEAEFKQCAMNKQPTQFDVGAKVAWMPAPEHVQCCPTQPNSDRVDFGKCFSEKWNRFGTNVPRLKNAAVASLLQDGQMVEHPNEFSDDVEGERHGTEKDGMDSQVESFLHTGHTHIMLWRFAGPIVLAVIVVVSFVGLSNGHVAAGGDYPAIGFWMLMSILMNVLNKKCTILFSCPFTLVLIQMLVAILLYARTSLAGMKASDLWRWCALSALFGLMLCSSMLAFMHSSVTCLLVLRNCLPILTFPLEKVILPTSAPVSASMVTSLAAIAIGAFLYAGHAPAGSGTTPIGYCWILVNCVASVTHRVLERMLLTSDMRLSFEAMTLINNVIPLPAVALLAWGTGELQHWPEYEHLLRSPTAIVVFLCSGVVGLCLGQGSIMVQKSVTATSMMVLQTTNKMAIIIAATMLFNDRFTSTSFIGCGLSLIGCAAYGMAQHSARQASLEHKPLIPK